eukprot:TRINITY_DN3350_c0_g2_i1.p1 TRINITY_DN3350_c0_g2~~TRINITY_DN3350_c0_g2_i1.p1  ORF type:complete len:414 (+),score=101.51 TRINITY_DN3350_c0_g2_i1:74-1315(+)
MCIRDRYMGTKRINSIKYLSSFIVRAKFLPSNVLTSAIGFIKDILQTLSSSNDNDNENVDNHNDPDTCSTEDLEQHQHDALKTTPSKSPSKSESSLDASININHYSQLFNKNEIFYYLVQHLMYIFINKKEEIEMADSGLSSIVTDFVKILKRSENNYETLKFISPRIVLDFKLLFQNYEGDWEIVVGGNNGGHISTTTKMEINPFMVDNYYPFDQYFLKHCESYLKDIYVCDASLNRRKEIQLSRANSQANEQSFIENENDGEEEFVFATSPRKAMRESMLTSLNSITSNNGNGGFAIHAINAHQGAFSPELSNNETEASNDSTFRSGNNNKKNPASSKLLSKRKALGEFGGSVTGGNRKRKCMQNAPLNFSISPRVTITQNEACSSSKNKLCLQSHPPKTLQHKLNLLYKE